MKPNHLFTSMLALATIVATSCSAPRLAQQSNNDDDVYNSVAQAKIYTPAPVPVQQTQNTATDYNEDDYYGTSDPYYDMDYSSRINRFYNPGSWRSYYDPYFDNWSMGGFGYGSFYGGWNSPYSGWGYLSSPFWGFNNWGYNNWGYNNWGWNNWGWNNYYGGGYYGGGFLGGGYYGGGYGGGYYTGRTTNVPQSVRPSRGSRDGYTPGRTANGGSDAYLSPRSQAARSARQGGNTTDGRTGTVNRPSRTSTPQPSGRTETTRPSRESYTPPAYSPPPARSSSGSGSSGSGSSGGSSSSGGGGLLAAEDQPGAEDNFSKILR